MGENIALQEDVMAQNAFCVKNYIQIERKKLKHKNHKSNYINIRFL